MVYQVGIEEAALENRYAEPARYYQYSDDTFCSLILT